MRCTFESLKLKVVIGIEPRAQLFRRVLTLDFSLTYPVTYPVTYHMQTFNRTSTLLSSTFIAATALAIAACANAADYQFFVDFDGGYRAEGLFSTKPDAPLSFTEANPNFPNTPFNTQYLQSMSLAVLQGGSAIDAGSTVIKGVSYEAFLHLAFDATTTPTVSAADISTQRGGVTSYYFLSNGVNPKGVTVPFGSTGYNLFRFTISTNSIEYLASGSAFTVTAVPAPGAAALLVLGALAGRRRRA